MTFPVEAGHVLLFARAVLDERPDHYDPTRSDGSSVCAPPTFTQAFMHFQPDFEMRPRSGQPWLGSGAQASGTAQGQAAPATGTVLHAEQRYEYHRYVHVGDVLTASPRPGATWTKSGKRGGLLTFSELITDFRDADGLLVITSTAVQVATSQPVGDPAGH